MVPSACGGALAAERMISLSSRESATISLGVRCRHGRVRVATRPVPRTPRTPKRCWWRRTARVLAFKAGSSRRARVWPPECHPQGGHQTSLTSRKGCSVGRQKRHRRRKKAHKAGTRRARVWPKGTKGGKRHKKGADLEVVRDANGSRPPPPATPEAALKGLAGGRDRDERPAPPAQGKRARGKAASVRVRACVRACARANVQRGAEFR